MGHSKGLIEPGQYFATCVHYEWTEITRLMHLKLWWVINTGPFAWRKISYPVPASNLGDKKLEQMMDRLGKKYEPSITDPGPLFELQFKALHARIWVEINSTTVNKNVIVYFSRSTGKPQHNVMSDGRTDHFFHSSRKPELPIDT